MSKCVIHPERDARLARRRERTRIRRRDKCPGCRGVKWREHRLCRNCNRGAASVHWKGDEVSAKGGRTRAVLLYELKDCERCGSPGRDRHHKDENTANNSPANIEILCRRCHMETDGRLARFVQAGENGRAAKPPKLCVTCGKPAKPSRHGECPTCASRTWRNRKEQAA